MTTANSSSTVNQPPKLNHEDRSRYNELVLTASKIPENNSANIEKALQLFQ
jgi:hypothetical protein